MTTIVDKAKLLKFKFPALDVAIVGKWIWISGNTRPQAAELKAAGLKFSSAKAKWYFAGENFRPRRAQTIPYAKIVQKYGESRVQPVTPTAEPVTVALSVI